RRHVRLLGLVHLDSRLPLATAIAGRPRTQPRNRDDIYPRALCGQMAWLRALRLLFGPLRPPQTLLSLSADRRSLGAALWPRSHPTGASIPRPVHRFFRPRTL